jgi:hypothetical protein
VCATGGSDARPHALDRIIGAITAGQLVVPVAATFTIERIRESANPRIRESANPRIRDSAALQRGGHVRGTVVVTR